MASTGFTFLNATGGPKLSKPEAKRMRGHITRVNFASRRARKEKADAQEKQSQDVLKRSHVAQVFAGPGLAMALSAATMRADPHHSAQLLAEFWSLVFFNTEGSPGSPGDVEWLRIHASEPALIDATMVLIVRYLSPGALCIFQAELHSYRALGKILQRIEFRQAHTDGFLLAALVMALGERLKQNHMAWDVHINGVAQGIKERRSRNLQGLPPAMMSFLITDSTNAVFNYPRIYHFKVVHEVADHEDGIISVLAALSQNLLRIRQWVNVQADDRSLPGGAPPSMQELWVKLYLQTKLLQGHKNPFVRVTIKAAEIILYISSPPEADISRLPSIADELKRELALLPGRCCWCLDLTSCQIIVGAIASAKGSETRAWFMAKLKKAVVTLQARGLDDAFAILERALAEDTDMLQRLRCLWKEENEAVSPSMNYLEPTGGI